MGWVEDKYADGTQPKSARANSPEADLRADQKWLELVNGLQADVEGFSRLSSHANFQKISETEYRVSNPTAGIAATVTADLAAQMIRYVYEPEGENVAVPEGGVLTLRTSGGSARLFSADQQLSSEQARRLVLEPLFFPSHPTDLEAIGT